MSDLCFLPLSLPVNNEFIHILMCGFFLVCVCVCVCRSDEGNFLAVNNDIFSCVFFLVCVCVCVFVGLMKVIFWLLHPHPKSRATIQVCVSCLYMF